MARRLCVFLSWHTWLSERATMRDDDTPHTMALHYRCPSTFTCLRHSRQAISHAPDRALHSHTHPHTYPPTHTHTRTPTDTQTHTQTHTHRHTDTHIPTNRHTHRHTHTETHRHTHCIALKTQQIHIPTGIHQQPDPVNTQIYI